VLTELDVGNGTRRTWTADRDVLVGEIVWAADSRTLGYSTSVPGGRRVSGVTMRTLDTRAPGTDLLGGHVVFAVPDDAGTVDSLTLSPDGRSGLGVLHKGTPPATILFSFADGRPMRVTSTIPADPHGGIVGIAVDTGDGPRYACLNGLDSFGRVLDGEYMPGARGFDVCGTTYYEP